MAKIFRGTKRDLQFLARRLRAGDLVAVPSETVYGLAADALSAKACRKIFQAKGRPTSDPLIVHVGSIAQAARIAEIGPAARKLMRQFWPGPLTLVLPKKPVIPDIVTSGRPSVAVRRPAHPLFLKLLAEAGTPLAAPSANPFGYVSPTTAQHVQDGLGNKIKYILDGGPSEVGVESTILDLRDPSRPRLLRPGQVTKAALSRVLRKRVSQATKAALSREPSKPAGEDRGKALPAPPSTNLAVQAGVADKRPGAPSTHLAVYAGGTDMRPGVPSTNLAVRAGGTDKRPGAPSTNLAVHAGGTDKRPGAPSTNLAVRAGGTDKRPGAPSTNLAVHAGGTDKRPGVPSTNLAVHAGVGGARPPGALADPRASSEPLAQPTRPEAAFHLKTPEVVGMIAPGMLARHYSPHTPVVAHRKLRWSDVENGPPNVAWVFVKRPKRAKNARNVFGWDEPVGEAKPARAVSAVRDPSGDHGSSLSTFAHNLFALLRQLDAQSWQSIHVEYAPRGGLGDAINDRLTRAAARAGPP